MNNKMSIREFAEGLLDKNLPVEEQSVICSSDVNLIGGDNAGCTNKDLNDLKTCLPVGPKPDPT